MDAEALRVALFTPAPFGRWGVPILNWGPPAVAKTTQVLDVAENAGFRVETLLGSTRQVEDFLGNPYFQDMEIVRADGTRQIVKATSHAMPDWAVRAFSDPYVIIHLDELSLTSTETQKGILRLVHEGVVGEQQLPNTVRFLGSANPPSMAHGTFDLSPPLVARWGHCMVNINSAMDQAHIDNSFVNAWTSWAIRSASSGFSATKKQPESFASRSARIEDVQDAVLASWDSVYSDVAVTVSTFMKSAAGGTTALFDMPPPDTVREGIAWPNPRSWEYAMRVMAAGKILGISQAQIDGLAAAFVGSGPIMKYNLFLKDINIPTADDFLSGRAAFTHDPLRLDRSMALLFSCAAHVCDPKCTNPDVKEDALWTFMDSLVATAQDICIPIIKLLGAAKKGRTKAGAKVLVKFAPILRAAGIHGSAP